MFTVLFSLFNPKKKTLNLLMDDLNMQGASQNNNPEYRIRTAGGSSSKYSNDRIAMRTTAPPATTQERVVNRRE
jgi:hypothetical protein